MTRRKKSISHLFSRVSCHYQYPSWCGLWRRTKSIAWREMHFAGKSFSQVCKNYPHLALSKKPHTIFVSIDYSTKSWSRFMSWIIELGILWLFITRTGICIRINPRQRFRRGQLLSYYGGASLNMSINYHVPVVNKNLTHISLSFSTAVFMKARQISHWGMKLYRLFCWIVFSIFAKHK